MIAFFKKLFALIVSLFTVPKLRVRTIDKYTGNYVYGTVEKTSHCQNGAAPSPMTYWTVIWDDAAGVWSTVPSCDFLWYGGFWTLIER